MNASTTYRVSFSVLAGLVGIALFAAVLSHGFLREKSPQPMNSNASPLKSGGSSAQEAIPLTSGPPAISAHPAEWGSTNHFGLPTSEDHASVMIEDEVQSQFNANTETFSSMFDELASRPEWSRDEEVFGRATPRLNLPANAGTAPNESYGSPSGRDVK